MSILDNQRLTIKVSKLYYEENLSQKEIAYLLGISRPQICRILTHARESGCVNIRIDDPFSAESGLEKQLVKAFGLRDAFVVDTGDQSGEAAQRIFGAKCAEQIEMYIPDNSLVGVMSGKTISAMANAIAGLERRNLEFVPMIGGMGAAGADWHANVIAHTLAEKAGGKYSILNAPVIVKNPEAREVLISEPDIKSVLFKGARCDVALIGIGLIDDNSAPYQAGVLTREDIRSLQEAGAVASACTSYVGEDGRCIDTPITERSIGVGLKKREDSTVIALAMGAQKARAIGAVLRGGYVDILFTSLDAARDIIRNAGGTNV